MRIKAPTSLFITGLLLFHFTGNTQVKNYTSEMKSLQANIQKQFFIDSINYYKESLVADKNSRPVSYLWPLCAMFEANNEIDRTLKTATLAAPTFTIIKKYHNNLPPASAFASYSMQYGGGSRFYDDNQWIGITAMDMYATSKKQQWLNTGKEIYRFMMTGYDNVTGGGLYWQEDDKKSKNTCSNGPGIILTLQLYEATKNKSYLDTALLLYDWVNKTLKAPSGLYYDNISTKNNHIGKQEFSYNTGTMLQSAVYLYECTKNPIYLKQATSIADSSLPFFFGTKKFKDDYWFETVLLRGYQHLLKYNKDLKYIKAFQVCVDEALDNEKNADGLMGKKQTQNLVSQGGMLEILARFAWLQQNGYL